jgi:hypothetical protein
MNSIVLDIAFTLFRGVSRVSGTVGGRRSQASVMLQLLLLPRNGRGGSHLLNQSFPTYL